MTDDTELPRDEYQEALEVHDTWLALIQSASTHEDDERIRSAVVPGIYEHFKSTPESPKYYAVQGVARRTDNGPFDVVYMALYPPHSGNFALRHLAGLNPITGASDSFLMPVDRPEIGYRGLRFRLVEPCAPEELFACMAPYRTS
jgi:hypothetical protein